MSKIKVKITYLDGTEKTVRASPRAQMMTEERFAGISGDTALRSTFYLGWASLNMAGQESAGWEEFQDKIEDVQLLKGDDSSLDPTDGETPSPFESSA